MESFSAALARELYLFGSGHKDTLDFVAIYEQHAELFTPDRIAACREACRTAGGEEGRSACHVYPFLVSHHIGYTLRHQDQALQRLRHNLHLRLGEQDVPYTYALTLVANEPNRERRRDWSARIEAATMAHLNPLAAGLIRAHQRLARDLGYSDYIELWDQARQLHLTARMAQVRHLLQETAQVACHALADDLDRYLGLSLDEAEPHDYSFLKRARHFDAHFPREQALPALRRALLQLGLDLDRQGHIHLDIEPRGAKSPRAFCAVIRPAGEIRLVVLPRGGPDDYHALFHEAGHALHFGGVKPGTPFEFARLGDISVTETYAFLFQHLLHEPAFLSAYLRLQEPVLSEYVRFARRQKLFLVRRYGARLRYELRLYRAADLDPMPQLYARELQAATFLRHSPAHALTDIEAGLLSAHYLRAWMAETQLRHYLQQQFGPRWWNNSAAGAFLSELWAWGNRYNVVELVQMLGYRDLDPEPLIRELTAPEP